MNKREVENNITVLKSRKTKKIIKCPRCHQKTLCNKSDSDVWYCETCEIELTQKDIRNLMIKRGMKGVLKAAAVVTVIGTIIHIIIKDEKDTIPQDIKSDREPDDPPTYNDVPDYSGSCPDCPKCGGEMGYSFLAREFKCRDCDYLLDEDDWDYDTGDPPWGCRMCSGPYPDCKASCNIFDD